ncbi:DUF6414 family protein [Acinetobacter pollinis]|uniref:DUF2184 domain-containing protein n=1 Tax=Acinetobacter pollinis TaxID=2605270 RepID=A0ABU6DQ77_9GAMM|nr:hypothetical protein [Acinetobacter pollinis]MEB5475989.1 hypothetical protein [Acinetobacter pollinis]
MAQESQNIESIFDFFYLDTRKINSFYAQLTGSGAISTRKNISMTLDEKTSEYTGNIKVASGKWGAKNNSGLNSEDLFDASVTMPREMIDRLDELGFINYDLNENQLGNLVLLKGSLGVCDVASMKEVIDPAVQFTMDQMPSLKPSEKTAKNQLKKMMDPLISFMKAIPFALQARFFDKGDFDKEVWMTLNRTEMFNDINDINFKYGDIMAGDWHVLGVLDAIPNDQSIKVTESNEINEVVENFTKMMKEQFGRPTTAYGMTPIAIFRVIKPNKA